MYVLYNLAVPVLFIKIFKFFSTCYFSLIRYQKAILSYKSVKAIEVANYPRDHDFNKLSSTLSGDASAQVKQFWLIGF